MNSDWIRLTQLDQLDEIDRSSSQSLGPVAIFKHSTRCSISSVALQRLERSEKHIPVYYLDLIAYRQISNAIAERYNVEHESPQLLIIEGGKAIEHYSHTSIQHTQIALNQ